MDAVQYALGPVASLSAWRACSCGVAGVRPRLGEPDLARCVARVRDLRRHAAVEAIGAVPLDVIVGDARRVHRCGALDTIVLRRDLPKWSFCSLGGDVYLCSPELCFVLLARGGDLMRLLAVGSELCGTYALRPDGSGGFVRRPGLTTTSDLATYLDHVGRRHGCRLARQALGALVDGLATPREAWDHLSEACTGALPDASGLGLGCGQYRVLREMAGYERDMRHLRRARVISPTTGPLA